MMFLLAVTFLVSTSGINIYQHYCSCEDQLITSAIPSSTCCDHQDYSDACCHDKAVPTTCCSETGKPGTTVLSKALECCTSTQHLFFRLSTDLSINVKLDYKQVITAFRVMYSTEPDLSFVKADFPDISRESTPLLMHGKILLTFIHQLRLDTSLA